MRFHMSLLMLLNVVFNAFNYQTEAGDSLWPLEMEKVPSPENPRNPDWAIKAMTDPTDMDETKLSTFLTSWH